MSVVIRLSRQGRRHHAVYRIAVADSKMKPQGRFLQQIGHYDPNSNPPMVKVDEAAAVEWMGRGAQPSETVHALFRRLGLMDKFAQVRSGKPLEQAQGSERGWKTRKKLHKKAKEALAKEREAAAKSQAEAEKPAEESPAS